MELGVDAKTKSRLDITKQLVFMPYNVQELKTILQSRVGSIAPKLFSEQAINLLCHQTASHYGDVRRLLQSASAALCGVLMNLNHRDLQPKLQDGIVSVKEIHGVVRQIFQDRFVEFIKAIRSPVLFLCICSLAKCVEDLTKRNASDCRVSLELLLNKVKEAERACLPSTKCISRAAFYQIIEILRQVSLLDISVGEERFPVLNSEEISESTEEVYVSLLQPVHTVCDACRFHDSFGSALASKLL
ncbi:origin recognition complex subunit 1 [Strigomonas culicis]|nr:origin recognition complex subunit 1 [Strigomonas culicis]|eukprot:EPY28950.1 origin recognition complex subunit 1 [Strigomonas culicis]